MIKGKTVLVTERNKKIVKLNPDVHKALGELVQFKGETYNDIIKRLIKSYKEHHRSGETRL